MTTLAEFMIVVGAENRPPMLDKVMYNSWESRMLLYIKGKKNGRMMLESIENRPLVYPTVEEDGLPFDLYALVNHCQFTKDIWERVKLLVKGTELSYQERECKLYNEFDKFTSFKGETLHEYYLRFAQLINDMHTTGMTMQQVQGHANEVRMMRERYPGPLALVANYQVQSNSAHSPQPQAEFPQLDSGLAALVFLPRDDLIACLNKAMAFMTTVVASRFPSTNNQLRTSSNLRNQATIQDGRLEKQGLLIVITIRVKGIWQGSALSLRDQGMLHGSRKRYYWLRAQEFGQVLDEEQLAFLADPRITDYTYDSNCDDKSSAKAVLMANLSSYCAHVLSEVPQHDSYKNNDVLNQSVQEMQYFEQSLADYVLDTEITSDSNIISYEQ
ncbi:hypothetical protein Tco_0448474 [Tanacetum coccineum]